MFLFFATYKFMCNVQGNGGWEHAVAAAQEELQGILQRAPTTVPDLAVDFRMMMMRRTLTWRRYWRIFCAGNNTPHMPSIALQNNTSSSVSAIFGLNILGSARLRSGHCLLDNVLHYIALVQLACTCLILSYSSD